MRGRKAALAVLLVCTWAVAWLVAGFFVLLR